MKTKTRLHSDHRMANLLVLLAAVTTLAGYKMYDANIAAKLYIEQLNSELNNRSIRTNS